jgi:ATP-dependent helicase IRC3
LQNRDYQDRCHSAIRAEYIKGTNRQLISMATGTGKTVVFSQLPDKTKDILPGQMLILAHREELIDQAIDKMRVINPRLRIDKEMAEHHADPSSADAIVASVATLGRKGTKRLRNYNWSRIDKYITDEAHHSVASSYLNIYDAAGLFAPDDKRLLLGVTATPQRGDGKALAQIYQKISFVYSMRQAIEDGWLVDVRGFRVVTNTSLDSVKTIGGDFAQDDLADAVNNPKRNQLVVEAWLDHAERRQTVVFTVDIKHALDLADMFRQYGVKAQAVWGNDPDRADKLERHRAGDITVLLNCGVLTEGYDDWRIACIVLARPTKSSVLFTQMVGRGTRLQEGTGNLKEYPGHITIGDVTDCIAERCNCPDIKRDCIVIDVVDASSRHSLITLPTLMGMSAKLNLKGSSLVRAIQQIEEAQQSHPRIDCAKLEDITRLRTMVEQVNLFDVKFPAEVEQNSELTWYTAADGGYVLLLPNKAGEMRIKQNMLDRWEITGSIHGQKYRGERQFMEEAFGAADELTLSKLGKDNKLLKREQEWHGDPATLAQIRMLNKFMKGTPLPPDLSKGQASRLIGSFLAGKA